MSLLLLLLGCAPETITITEYIEVPCDSGDSGDPAVCEDFTAPSAPEVVVVEDCVAQPDPIRFVPEIEWTWAPPSSTHTFNQVMMTPVVGNLTDDDGDGAISAHDTPDVVFTAYQHPHYGDSPGALLILDGDSGAEQAYYTSLTDSDGNSHRPQARGGVALGDIDADGVPEACFPTDRSAVICAHADGEVVMVADTPTTVDRDEWIAGYPAIGDMDGDGLAEVVMGRMIWDHDGALLGLGAGSHGGYVHSIYGALVSASVLADMDGDRALEVVAGDTVYERDGTLLWAASDGTNGFSAVADLDGDGSPDIVTTGVGVANILDSAGALTASFTLPGCATGHTCGPPTIADFDADGEPEIGIAGDTLYTVYDNDAGTWAPLWSEAIYDRSGATGAVVFDFEADGESEVVFADEEELYVWSGPDGAARLGNGGWDPTEHANGTGMETPSLADIDRDGSTEILVGSNELYTSGWYGVRAIGNGSGEAWAPSRPVWNQHSYHLSNIEDDLSLPDPEAPHWTQHNSFRAQDLGERPGSWQADLAISAVDQCDDCAAGETTLYLVVENQGLAASGPVELVLSSGNVELVTERVDLQAGQSQVLGPYTVDHADWTGALTATIDARDEVEECDEENNVLTIGELPCHG